MATPTMTPFNVSLEARRRLMIGSGVLIGLLALSASFPTLAGDGGLSFLTVTDGTN